MRRQPAHPADGDDPSAGLLAHRTMLFGLAYRMLGSVDDAEDVLQEAYLRWHTTDRSTVEQPRRYLSRVVTHLAIDKLRQRKAARETYIGEWLPEPLPTVTDRSALPAPNPVEAVEQRESLSIATLHLLERLTPPERAVFVLRTAFDVPYAEIAETLHRTPADCRQLYRRATQRLADRPRQQQVDRHEQRRLLTGFVAAARNGDTAQLTRMLAADATAWSDGGGRVRAAVNPIRGADRVARFFAGIYAPRTGSMCVRALEVNGDPAVFVEYSGMRHVLAIDADADGIMGVYLIANPDKLTRVA
jgi:RNA polymerase sigma-70 factor (ECF subfamily)